MSILDNFRIISDDVRSITIIAGRKPEDVEIIAVSKTYKSGIIQEAINQGIHLFGESKVQEAKQKIREARGNFVFHLIGHLQSNKAKDAVSLFDVIHTLDKFSTAEAVNSEAEKIFKVQKALVQVNTSGEETKNGVFPEDTTWLIKDILHLKNIEILGLMTIGPLTDDNIRIRESFKMLKNLLETINKEIGLNMKELSMGMSGDYGIAVQEGATMLRIGTAIFGRRDYTK